MRSRTLISCFTSASTRRALLRWKPWTSYRWCCVPRRDDNQSRRSVLEVGLSIDRNARVDMRARLLSKPFKHGAHHPLRQLERQRPAFQLHAEPSRSLCREIATRLHWNRGRKAGGDGSARRRPCATKPPTHQRRPSSIQQSVHFGTTNRRRHAKDGKRAFNLGFLESEMQPFSWRSLLDQVFSILVMIVGMNDSVVPIELHDANVSEAGHALALLGAAWMFCPRNCIL
ncbi:hypothetical protein H310_13617 [Aphanomyces invadans]|uniref:Uncharacterized protein n=1 Tax=Aphanomyces invadans TaxID=157072 RepID=A0A024TF79_9STRA|nr:hypothetical protein H310_13617 [Aphanomyces invadans]ETV91977.1 hypothetical protein H310_13617 [Aphanomyces invadans]|eukprot:XP_008879401.1 hypothetical protein H310_13617 [Aphanomyces invadans]